ncbi:hypothetical protein N9196_02930, partial [Akkermansiaceae bacterium]|nr:hypothetical protein [Akkermansiaceae bacterium]
GSHICPPIVHDGHIYFLTHENATLKKKKLWPELGLYCLTKDGEKLWNSGAEPMFGRGSMILADGKLIIRDSYYGKLYLVKPDPKGYRQLAVANPLNRFSHQQSPPHHDQVSRRSSRVPEALRLANSQPRESGLVKSNSYLDQDNWANSKSPQLQELRP